MKASITVFFDPSTRSYFAFAHEANTLYYSECSSLEGLENPFDGQTETTSIESLDEFVRMTENMQRLQHTWPDLNEEE